MIKYRYNLEDLVEITSAPMDVQLAIPQAVAVTMPVEAAMEDWEVNIAVTM